MRLKGFLGLVFLGLTTFVRAQVSTVVLDSAVLSPRGITRVSTLDSLSQYSGDNIGEILTENGLVFVKATAGGGLSTLSIRGGNAEQSTVYWNGMSLQNILNGNVDMNLLPSLAFDQVEMNSYQSSNSGSGSIAGSINLRNKGIDTSRLLISQLGFGTFGRIQASAKWNSYGKKSLRSLTLFTNSAKNNYNYPALGGDSLRQLKHAQFRTNGVLVHQQIFLKRSNPLNIRAWFQSTDRQIAPTMLEAVSTKNQMEQTIRIQADWSKTANKNELKVNSGIFLENFDYQDSLSKIFANYKYVNSSLMGHFLHKYNSKLSVGFDLESRLFQAFADTFYDRNRIEFSQAFHASYKTSKMRIQTSVRMVEYTNNADLPILGSLKVFRKLSKRIKAMALVSSNYRMPTFNNLFWNPGGNENLVSERSVNSEFNLMYEGKQLEIRFTGFDNYIKDQIRWLPGSRGYFEATQVRGQTQWNRGLEISGTWSVKPFNLFANATVVNSTLADTSLWSGLQQTFVPRFQGNAGLRYTVKKWTFEYSNWFISKRFTDKENTEFLPSIFINSIRVMRKVKDLTISLSIKNIDNHYYTVMPYMPNMPRNIELKISHQLTKK